MARKWQVLIMASEGAFMGYLDVTIVNNAWALMLGGGLATAAAAAALGPVRARTSAPAEVPA